MTARRSLLGYAVGAVGAALLGGCTPRTGDRVYVGPDGAVAAYELARGREVGRISVPGLVEVRLARRA
ncbi:MAG TPA: hypothetical protein VFM55_10435 [Micromonosporaceae bacterium]|nr:hypothetical protein [Micromonosporaceae bacterium]